MGKAQPEGLFSSLGNLSNSLQALLPLTFCCSGPEEGLGSAHLLSITSRNVSGARQNLFARELTVSLMRVSAPSPVGGMIDALGSPRGQS